MVQEADVFLNGAGRAEEKQADLFGVVAIAAQEVSGNSRRSSALSGIDKHKSLVSEVVSLCFRRTRFRRTRFGRKPELNTKSHSASVCKSGWLRYLYL